MTPVRITKLTRVGDFFTANVSANGRTVRADNRLGSWTATTDPQADPAARNVRRREILPAVAKLLQERLRKHLRGEQVNDHEEFDVAPARRRSEHDARPAPQTRRDLEDARRRRPDAAKVAEAMAKAGRKAVER